MSQPGAGLRAAAVNELTIFLRLDTAAGEHAARDQGMLEFDQRPGGFFYGLLLWIFSVLSFFNVSTVRQVGVYIL